MNTTQKGKRSQNKTVKALEGAGYRVETAKAVRYQPEDFFELFDHIAIRRDGKEIRLIQTKSNRLRKEVREAIKEFPFELGSKEVWVWHDKVDEPEIIFL